MSGLLSTLVLIVGSALYLAWAGYAMTVLWGWFVFPVYGVAITWRQIAPVLLMFHLAAPTRHGTGNDVSTADVLAMWAIKPALTLAVGYVLKWIIL